ncbi:NF-kappa-B inhibitor-like protein 1 [Tachyglossus aculeatus]|uniref:NF-kappa-B inhibitor-like protein 1 n=1 Tax=Tachyglossus aculeatus TaxID=9261 RepID=UPI0018F62A6E|nr:NF-kappa-B inhibitor-like protein 1 [Tachyglossus aculeatus]XP_038624833.1 NF-kappa-B inhibitor-like protein 1 [Tachyglossus aculeatus]
MGSSSRRHRREHRFRRYLSTGRLGRARALLRRHPELDVDSGQPPPLHRACARRDPPALRLLLRRGADPARQDRHGDTALHAAARQGPDAYKDLFLPLLSRCPAAMGMRNKSGETPGELLGWGAHPEPPPPQEEPSGEAEDAEWRWKLYEELQDEWQEILGRFEDDDPQEEPETYSAWTERLAREHAQRRRQRDEPRRPRHPAPSTPYGRRWPDEGEEQRLYRERARAKERELQESRARREREKERERAEERAGDPGRRLWGFKDVPWPGPGGGDAEAMAAALLAGGPPTEPAEPFRKFLRAQRVLWHPDRFLQRFGSRLDPRERARVLEAVTALSQALNRRAESLK